MKLINIFFVVAASLAFCHAAGDKFTLPGMPKGVNENMKLKDVLAKQPISSESRFGLKMLKKMIPNANEMTLAEIHNVLKKHTDDLNKNGAENHALNQIGTEMLPKMTVVHFKKVLRKAKQQKMFPDAQVKELKSLYQGVKTVVKMHKLDARRVTIEEVVAKSKDIFGEKLAGELADLTGKHGSVHHPKVKEHLKKAHENNENGIADKFKPLAMEQLKRKKSKFNIDLDSIDSKLGDKIESIYEDDADKAEAFIEAESSGNLLQAFKNADKNGDGLLSHEEAMEAKEDPTEMAVAQHMTQSQMKALISSIKDEPRGFEDLLSIVKAEGASEVEQKKKKKERKDAKGQKVKAMDA